MLFSSLLFLFRFLPIVILLYFIVPRKFKNFILLVSSLIFYAWGEPKYVFLMMATILLDYVTGLVLEYYLNRKKAVEAKITLIISVILNLSGLCFFKYIGFLTDNINNIPGVDLTVLKIALPIGISFYTFQSMSYIVDVYRGVCKAQHNIISFGTYVTLFPQLIAGPIVQYKTIAEQLDDRKETVSEFSEGIVRFMSGLGKKVLFANNIGILWDQISVIPTAQLPVATAWLGALAFALQIYFDFSGYSDMAIGLGKMFGFTFLENFNYPYLSKSITEFWRRWHISLGTWFREYLYIPLGGNRCSKGKQIRNIAVVWLLTGLWHGASWNFVAWGGYFGVLLLIEKLFLGKWLSKLPSILQHFYTWVVVLISWMIFAFEDMGQAFSYIGAMFGAGASFANTETMYFITNNVLLLIILLVGATNYPKKWVDKIAGLVRRAKAVPQYCYMVIENVYVLTVFILSIAYLVDSSYNPFLYFRF